MTRLSLLIIFSLFISSSSYGSELFHLLGAQGTKLAGELRDGINDIENKHATRDSWKCQVWKVNGEIQLVTESSQCRKSFRRHILRKPYGMKSCDRLQIEALLTNKADKQPVTLYSKRLPYQEIRRAQENRLNNQPRVCHLMVSTSPSLDLHQPCPGCSEGTRIAESTP